jgi:hypothetical protein
MPTDAQGQDTVIALDNDNVFAIIHVFTSGFIALPDNYTTGFSDYFTSVVNTQGEIPAYDFWEFTVLHFVRKSSYPLEEIHNTWIEAAAAPGIGWHWNAEFSRENKTCPLLQSFTNLSMEEQAIVRLIAGTVFALVLRVDEGEEAESDANARRDYHSSRQD